MNVIEWTSYHKLIGTDWANCHRVSNSIIYLSEVNKYERAKCEPFLYKYFFGKHKKVIDVEDDIKWWFNRCLGAYNKIDHCYHNENELGILKDLEHV